MKETKYIITGLNLDISKSFDGNDIILDVKIKAYENIKNVDFEILKQQISDGIEKAINKNNNNN